MKNTLTVKSRRKYVNSNSRSFTELVFPEKVAAWGTRRIHECRIQIILSRTAKNYELSICGDIWNSRLTDIVRGGQCLDSMLEYAISAGWSQSSLSLLREIVDLWKKYHLNSMHAGTPEQEAALADFKGDFTAKCERLKELGLYEVEHNGKSYRYGSAWLYWPIPDEDLARIWNLFNI